MIDRNIVIIAVAIGLYWAIKRFRKENAGAISDKAGRIFALLAMVFAVSLMEVINHFGTKIPGSYFERHRDYEGMFYINLFPDGQKVKSYRVPAMVTASDDVVGTGMDGDHEIYDVYGRVYKIQFAIMPNGGKVSFNDPYEALELGKMVTMFDADKRYWGIELTNRSVGQSARVVK